MRLGCGPAALRTLFGEGEVVLSTILVTGGAGFIGGSFLRRYVPETGHRMVNLDLLTYAGNLESLQPVAGCENYRFVQGDIRDANLVRRLLRDHQPRAIVHFAAESHVDRSIGAPATFIQTNVVGTQNLLECARGYWSDLDSAAQARISLSACFDRRGLRIARTDGALHGTIPLCPELALFRFESRCRSSGPGLLSHLRAARSDLELLQQLRALSVSGKTDPADDSQRAGRKTAPCLR